jgi:hypothetical protein
MVKDTSKNLKELRLWEKELKAKSIVDDIIDIQKNDDLPF